MDEDKNNIFVSAKFLANIFSTSESGVYQLVKNGVIPKLRKGNYKFVDSVREYIKYLHANNHNKTKYFDSVKEKGRLIKAQADKTEMEVSKIRGELVDIKELETALEKVFKAFRERALSIPSKLTPVLLNQKSSNEIRSIWIKIVQRKTGHKVKVPIHPKLKAVLNSIPTPIHSDKRLFPDCNPKAISTAFRRACERAGKIGFHFHNLRHFCASYLVNNGIPLFSVSKYLGHRSVKTTEIYAYLNDENLEGAGDSFTDSDGDKLVTSGFLRFQNACK